MSNPTRSQSPIRAAYAWHNVFWILWCILWYVERTNVIHTRCSRRHRARWMMRDAYIWILSHRAIVIHVWQFIVSIHDDDKRIPVLLVVICGQNIMVIFCDTLNFIFFFSNWFVLIYTRSNQKLTTKSWWRHQMETFSALLALCAGNSPVTREFPSQRPVTRSFDDFFDMHLKKWLSKQSRRRWFETPSCSLCVSVKSKAKV